MASRSFWRNNGLSLALIACFVVSQVGLAVAGHRHYNEEQAQHGEAPVDLATYLRSPQFAEATTENWESEFLQMWAFVMFTVFLFQRGSAESKDPDKPSPMDRYPRSHPDAPGPVKRGGWRLALYQRSLSLLLFALFALSMWLHAWSGALAYNEEQRAHAGETVSAWQYVRTSQFWFESLQNWQSEFFSVAVLVLATIVLRQRGSAQSKPVDAPHRETGSS